MCGIAGIWAQTGVKQDLLGRMAAEIRHRGPDDEGFYERAGVGLASRRLSIIDVDSGRQPIANEDGTVWIVFNGEIYNYPALRERLAAHGHRFKTNTDTEVVIHLYEEYGPDCVKELRGMFAFAIWDELRQSLFLARDPLGQKPLYYAQQGETFVFGSEIKSLLQHEAIKPRLNPRALHHYISLRYVPGDDTLFEGISKLPAGHTLLRNEEGATVQRYWDLQYEPKLPGSAQDITRQLRDLLLETVECHMLSDVPLGAFLSGGIDSSLVVALMSTLSPTPIKTFSIGVRDESFSELPWARLVAQRYGTEHHELVVEPNLVGTLPRMLWHMEEPVDPFAFGVYSVAQLASQHVKVVLGGDGGDEMFAGYDRYFGNRVLDLYWLLPAPLRHRFIEPLINRLPDNFGYNNRVQKLRWLATMSETKAGERYAQSASLLRFGPAHKEALYTDTLWRAVGGLDSYAEIVRHFDAGNASDPVDRMLFTDVRTRLADHLLMVVDRMTMAHSLEGRSPYVDQEVAAFAARIPAHLKLHGRRLKHIEREVAREFLPAALIKRSKQGFGFPLARWFRGELRPVLTNVLGDSRLVAEGYFRPEAIRTLLDEHVSGRVDHNYRLWLLFNLELWHRLFMEGQSQAEIGEMLARHSAPAYLPPPNGRASAADAPRPPDSVAGQAVKSTLPE
ncbi:MAG: asparagine synthase (glutamine-hydrolyzing) [Chloroflexota bacterium]